MPAKAQSGTLVAGVVTTVTLNRAYSTVTVTNQGIVPIYLRLDWGDPVVAGPDCLVVDAGDEGVFGYSSTYDQGQPGTVNPGTVVKMISSATPTYTVVGS